MIFIDSNMWCYYFDQRLPEHEQVREPMREIIKSEEIVCNTLIIMEIANYLVRHFKEKAAQKKIDPLVNLRNIRIVDFDNRMLKEALENILEHGYSDGLVGRAATVIATLNSECVKRIFSHDGIFKRLASKLEYEVIDPIPVTPT